MTREEALRIWLPVIKMGVESMQECSEAVDMAIKALEQEPFINKPCVSKDVCEHDKNVTLDKIRAEIEERETYEGVYLDRYDVLEIIDKYKAESEE